MNPRAGGAEILTFEIARRLAAQGNYVEWFSAAFPGSERHQDIDGVHFVRAGRQWTVHFEGFRRYHRILRTQFDVVIDEVNTMPFFTPLWAKTPTIMLTFQLAREVWWYETFFPVSLIGYALEPLYLRLYRRVPVLTISASTSSDLRRLGFTGPITVVPVGVEVVRETLSVKAFTPTFIYVGRLTPSKRVSDILRAIAIFESRAEPAIVWLVGQGPDRHVRSIRRVAKRLGISERVVFCGRLDTADKHRKMGEAHALLMTSVREGWGLAINEANACGTPAVVYDVPGLRDAVRHRITGLVVPPTPEKLASALLELYEDRGLRDRLGRQAKTAAETLSFDLTATAVRNALATPTVHA